MILELTRFETDYHLNEQQTQHAKRVRFLIIGAGFSGLCCGYFFKLMGLDFVIVEKGQQVGGTWLWNKYPGVEESRVLSLGNFVKFLR